MVEGHIVKGTETHIPGKADTEKGTEKGQKGKVRANDIIWVLENFQALLSAEFLSYMN